MGDYTASAGFEAGYGSPEGGLDLGFGDPTWSEDVIFGTGYGDAHDPSSQPWYASTGGGFITWFPPAFVLDTPLNVGEEGGYLLTLQSWLPLADGYYRVVFEDALGVAHPLADVGAYGGIAGQGGYARPTYGGYALIVGTPPMQPDEYSIKVYHPSGAVSLVAQTVVSLPMQACSEADALASWLPGDIFNTRWKTW